MKVKKLRHGALLVSNSCKKPRRGISYSHYSCFWPSETNDKIAAAAEQEFIKSPGSSRVGVNRQIDHISILQTQIKKKSPVSDICFLEWCCKCRRSHHTLQILCLWGVADNVLETAVSLSVEVSCLVLKTLKLDTKSRLAGSVCLWHFVPCRFNSLSSKYIQGNTV